MIFSYKHIVVVHGIGDQAPNETALGFMNEFIRAIPLDDKHTLKIHNLIESVDVLQKGDSEKPRAFQPAYIAYSDATAGNTTVIGFSEVFWQPITNGYIKRNQGLPIPISTWAHSIATRLLSPDEGKSTYALTRWRTAIENLEVMLKLARKLANVVGYAQTFDSVTVKFLGDVQMYAESDKIRQEVNAKFFSVLARIDGFANETQNSIRGHAVDPRFAQFNEFRAFSSREIYVIAHSEGTVVAYNSLVQAGMLAEGPGANLDEDYAHADAAHMGATKGGDAKWLSKVAGLVTLGSPLDKHYLIWRNRFRKSLLTAERTSKIPWLNFCDYNDPVGYKLSELFTPGPGQKSPTECDAYRMFDLTGKGSDWGFQRYPIPGKAHVDYWQDRAIHQQIVRLMGLGELGATFPGDIPWVRALRPILIWPGYLLVRALTICAGLFFSNRILHVGGIITLGPLQPIYDWLQTYPFMSPPMNLAAWLAAPVILMKLFVQAERGWFLGFELSRWFRWLASVLWLFVSAIVCIGITPEQSEAGLSDVVGYATGLLLTVLVWQLHTTVHRGLIQLWRSTATV